MLLVYKERYGEDECGGFWQLWIGKDRQEYRDGSNSGCKTRTFTL